MLSSDFHGMKMQEVYYVTIDSQPMKVRFNCLSHFVIESAMLSQMKITPTMSFPIVLISLYSMQQPTPLKLGSINTIVYKDCWQTKLIVSISFKTLRLCKIPVFVLLMSCSFLVN